MSRLNLNQVQICGNVGQDPEVKQIGNNTTVCNLSIATTERWKDAQGEKQEKTEWHRITLWGKQAETAGRMIHKGDHVYVQGSLQTRSWEKDGEKRYATDIKAYQWMFASGSASGSHRANQGDSGPVEMDFGADEDDGNLPF